METIRIKQATKKGYIECVVGGVADFTYPTSRTRRARVQGGVTYHPHLQRKEVRYTRWKQNLEYAN